MTWKCQADLVCPVTELATTLNKDAVVQLKSGVNRKILCGNGLALIVAICAESPSYNCFHQLFQDFDSAGKTET
ncbi:hypothetical protein [Paenochrobactrum glaciei]|uniref:Uncharacterized protein n=1 Tax=Paenochrobactrum glaciei TaxID=486407 RepID=A0ABN1FFV5_9HYPH